MEELRPRVPRGAVWATDEWAADDVPRGAAWAADDGAAATGAVGRDGAEA